MTNSFEQLAEIDCQIYIVLIQICTVVNKKTENNDYCTSYETKKGVSYVRNKLEMVSEKVENCETNCEYVNRPIVCSAIHCNLMNSSVNNSPEYAWHNNYIKRMVRYYGLVFPQYSHRTICSTTCPSRTQIQIVDDTKRA